MRLLLVAYEFPPGSSPQALRWTYLVRELALRGHEVHVLAPRVPAHGGGLPGLPANVRLHRTFAGPAIGLLAWLSARGPDRASDLVVSIDDAAPAAPMPATKLNWKGRAYVTIVTLKRRLFDAIKSLWGYCLFPDIRAEWNPWARREFARVLRSVKPDVVLASHEPASCLAVALTARRSGTPVVADLGDPVLAPYTPRRWRRRALRLERRVMREAEHVFVTSEKARTELHARHGIDSPRCSVLTQGFDARTERPQAAYTACAALQLVYTGSFYDFRRADALLDALRDVEGVELSVASSRVPDVVARFAAAYPEKLRILGYVAHSQALALQRRADVLVNLANADPVQVPGKVYEYLGACRPILHVRASAEPEDAAGALVAGLARGWHCANDSVELTAMLEALSQLHRAGRLHDGLDLGLDPVANYSWQSLAGRAEAVLCTVSRRSPHDAL